MYRGLAAGFLAAAFALVALPAAAAQGFIDTKKYDPERFPELADMVRAEMEPGGRFEDVSADERIRVEQELRRMAELLAGARSLEELEEPQRVALINAQGRVNAILTKRDGERLICERRALVGSHRTETYCETAHERRDRSEYSRKRKRELELKSCGAEINCG